MVCWLAGWPSLGRRCVNPSTLASLPSHLESGFIARKSSRAGGLATRGMTKVVLAPMGLESAMARPGSNKTNKKGREKPESFIGSESFLSEIDGWKLRTFHPSREQEIVYPIPLMFGFLSIVLEAFPEVRPGLAEVSAQKNVGIAIDGAIHDAISVREVAGQFTRLEALIQEVAMHSDHDERLRRRIAVPAQPRGFRAAEECATHPTPLYPLAGYSSPIRPRKTMIDALGSW